MFRLDLGKYSTNGGFLSPSLAAILYQTALGDFVYQTDSNGNVVLDNQGTLTSAYDGLPYSGRGIQLGALNDVEFPIHHTLGVELCQNPTVEALTATQPFNGTETLDSTVFRSASGTNSVRFNLTNGNTITYGGVYVIAEGKTVSEFSIGDVVVFEAWFKIDPSNTIGGGAPRVTTTTSRIFLDSQYMTAMETDGDGFTRYRLEATVTENDPLIATGAVIMYVNFDTTRAENQDVVFYADGGVSTREVVSMANSFLTYHDIGNDEIITLGNSVDGGSSDSADALTADGTFSTSDGWSLETSSWLISGGTLNYTHGVIERYAQGTSALLGGKHYAIEFEVISTDELSTLSFKNGALTETFVTDSTYAVGTHMVTFTPSSNYAVVRIYGNLGNISIDNISVKEILPVSTKYTLNTKTVNNVLKHTTPWSPTSRAKVENNPNLIGKLALETTGATKTIPELDMVMDAGASADSYYMCSEDDMVGSYLVDSRDVQTDETIAFTSVTFGDEIGTSSNVGNDVHVEVTTVGTLSYRPMITWDFGTSVDGQLYVTEFDLIVNSGTVDSIITGFNIGSGTGTTDFGTYSAGTYKVSIIEKANGTDGIVRLRLNGTNLFNADINNIKTRKATGAEIADYTSTIRDNADLQQKGIQTTAFVTDTAGVPTAYSSNLLQFNGDGRYVDTGFIPSGDWSIECIIPIFATAELYNAYIDNMDIAPNKIWIWTSGNGTRIRYDVGNSLAQQTVVLTAGYYHWVTTYNSATDTVTGYLSSVAETPFVAGLVSSTKSIYIGKSTTDTRSAEYGASLPIIHNKLLTAEEVATAYAKAKAIYPSIV